MTNLNIEIQKHEQLIILVKGQYKVEFHFIDGKLEKVVHNLPYYKTLNDWDYYAKAINAMLRKARTLKIDFEQNDNVPF